MNREHIIHRLKSIKRAIGVWGNNRIISNIDRLILEYKAANNNNKKKGKLINCIANGQVILESETDGSISIYEVV